MVWHRVMPCNIVSYRIAADTRARVCQFDLFLCSTQPMDNGSAQNI